MKLSSLAVALVSVIGFADASGFARTCKSWKVTGTNNVVLRGCCLDARGYYRISELHLKHCLANIGGLVKKKEGNFHKSCNNCRVQSSPNSKYTCKCFIEGEENDWYDVTYDDLNRIISNLDAKLGCFNAVGGDKGTDSGCKGYGAQLLSANGFASNGTSEGILEGDLKEPLEES